MTELDVVVSNNVSREAIVENFVLKLDVSDLPKFISVNHGKSRAGFSPLGQGNMCQGKGGEGGEGRRLGPPKFVTVDATADKTQCRGIIGISLYQTLVMLSLRRLRRGSRLL